MVIDSSMKHGENTEYDSFTLKKLYSSERNRNLKNIAVYIEPGLTWHTSGQQILNSSQKLSLTDICYIVFYWRFIMHININIRLFKLD
jgi:hypothetical protein